MNLTERVTRVRARNPSPMTLDGTNTYLVDLGGAVAVIDPGPADPVHEEAIVAAAARRGAPIGAILVTHGHPDHYPLAASLAARVGAPVYAHERAAFAHDVVVGDGDAIAFGDAALVAVDAPGHARDHLVFHLPSEDVLFTGDVVVGQGTVVVAPPGGDMRVYQATLERLRSRFATARAIFGGHGERVDDVRTKLDEYIAHRRERERGLVDVLRAGPATVPAIVRRLYSTTSPALWPAAARQTLAYLEALEREGRVASRALARPQTLEEAQMLHPDLSRLGDPELARVVADELGLGASAEPMREYVLLG